MNFTTISSFKVINHVSSCLLITVVENVVLWIHVPLDLMDLVGSVGAILGHDDGTFELSVDKSGIVPHSSICDQGEAMIN